MGFPVSTITKTDCQQLPQSVVIYDFTSMEPDGLEPTTPALQIRVR